MKIGSFAPVAPVVLAPMAGVTNAPFRSMCREFAPGLIYVNEMVMATAVGENGPMVRIVQPMGTNILNMQLCYFSQYILLFGVGLNYVMVRRWGFSSGQFSLFTVLSKWK